MSINILVILSIVILTAIIIAVAFFVSTQTKKKSLSDTTMALLQQQLQQLSEVVQQRLNETNQALDRKLSESHQLTRDQFAQNTQVIQGITRESRELLHQVNQQSNQMIRQVTEKLTKLDDTNRQVIDFSSQLKNLQDILKNPKQRGVLGEYFLEETLKNVLPPNSYQMQYRFRNGDIVDAVVFVKEKIIPIDSKFSLEKYEQLLGCNDPDQRVVIQRQFKADLKNRIDETAKYVKPDEKTMDFAFMFIPSESIYYDLLVNKVGSAQISSRDLIDYAFKEKHVIIVSPTSFLAYLQTVLQGLRALQIEESAKLIRKNVEKLAKHLYAYQSYFEKIGTGLGSTVNHYNRAGKELLKVDKDILNITEKSSSSGPSSLLEIEKPATFEPEIYSQH